MLLEFQFLLCLDNDLESKSKYRPLHQCVILFDNLNFEFLKDASLRNLFSFVFDQCFGWKRIMQYQVPAKF